MLQQPRNDAVHAAEGRIAAVDGLRAVAVVSVLLYHLDPGWLPSGFTGVDIFFVISGFVVTLAVQKLRRTSFLGFLTEFYARRMRRILPALFVCLGVTVLATVLFVPSAWVSAENRQTALLAFLGLSNVHLALVTDTYFATRTTFNPTVHTWSLGVEEQFYLIAPFLYYAGLKLRDRGRRTWPTTATFLGLAALSLIGCGALMAVEPKFAFYLLPARFWELATGALLALSMPRWAPAIADRPILHGAVVAAAGVLTAAALTIADPAAFPFPFALLPVAASVAFVVGTVSRPDGPVAVIMSSRAVVWVGLASYSIYLWHWPVIVLMRWTVGVDALWQKLVAILLTLALATFSYTVVERPFRYGPLVRRLRNGQVVAIGLALAIVGSTATYLGFRGQPYMTLSVTGDRTHWYPDYRPETLPAEARCGVDFDDGAFADGERMIFTPTGCDQPAGGRLFVLGDSHAWAYSQLFGAYAAMTGVPVTVLTRGGCSMPDPFGDAGRDDYCRAFLDASDQLLDEELRAGDILFLPAFRIPAIDKAGAWMETPAPTRAPNAAEMSRLDELAAKGVTLLFDAPKPVYSVAAYRCSDWFNRINPDCTGSFEESRTELETYRAPVVAALEALVARLPGAALWDPFPVLCPGETCGVFDGEGRPLMFDGNHLSGHADQRLLGDFIRRIEPLRTRTRVEG